MKPTWPLAEGAVLTAQNAVIPGPFLTRTSLCCYVFGNLQTRASWLTIAWKEATVCLLTQSPGLLQAEARLAAKRAARAEAREIRMKELERQQKEVRPGRSAGPRLGPFPAPIPPVTLVRVRPGAASWTLDLSDPHSALARVDCPGPASRPKGARRCCFRLWSHSSHPLN